MVSTLVVEWIEIHTGYGTGEGLCVSTLVVEWIEITLTAAPFIAYPASPPSWWSGLKSVSLSYGGEPA